MLVKPVTDENLSFYMLYMTNEDIATVLNEKC